MSLSPLSGNPLVQLANQIECEDATEIELGSLGRAVSTARLSSICCLICVRKSTHTYSHQKILMTRIFRLRFATMCVQSLYLRRTAL